MHLERYPSLKNMQPQMSTSYAHRVDQENMHWEIRSAKKR